jgi:SAM-dependent methyltransferase
MPAPLEDRWCYPGALDNPLRRRLAPAPRDLDLPDLAPGQTVVDLGTGVGFFVPGLLARLGPGSLHLVEPDPENLALARDRARGDPRVRTYGKSAAEFRDLPDGSVDRILLSLVLCPAFQRV